MALIFPDNPQIGDTATINGRTWEWDGERWLRVSDLERGETGFTGSRGFVGSVGFGYAGSIGLPGGAPRNNQILTGDGLTSRFILDSIVGNSVSIFVIVNGLVLIPHNDYVIENSNELLIYDTPNELSDIEIRFFDEAGFTGSFGATGYRGSVGFRGSNGLAQVYVNPVAPSYEETIDGELWWDTENGILNIWYTDEETWVGIQQGPRGFKGYAGSLGYTGSRGFTGSFGYTGSQGIIGPTGYDGSRGAQGIQGIQGIQGAGFVGSKGFDGSIGTLGYTGSFGAGYTGSVGYVGSKGSDALLVEDYSVISGGATNFSLDIEDSNVFKISPTGDFTINFQNVSLIPINKTTTFVIIITQGSTAYKPTTISFDGAAQTVLWQGTAIPSGNASKTDAISFTVLKNSSGAYTVLGQLIGFG